MKTIIRIAALAALGLAAALPCAAQYPDRPVTILAGFPPGGLVDLVARVLADGMKPKFPKGMVVANKAGAGGALAVAETAIVASGRRTPSSRATPARPSKKRPRWSASCARHNRSSRRKKSSTSACAARSSCSRWRSRFMARSHFP